MLEDVNTFLCLLLLVTGGLFFMLLITMNA
jgi:hypothetical protein